MNGGAKYLGAAAVIAVAACTSESGKVEIRASAVPPSAAAKPVPARIAEARGQLALGNVALALESFRRAAREMPSSVDALTGMAECYDRMGRHDLARRNLEGALALAPADTTLLTALASSLELQGASAEASRVRGEIRNRLAAAQPRPTPPALGVLAPKPREQAVALTVQGPVSSFATTEALASLGSTVTIALPAARTPSADVPASLPRAIAENRTVPPEPTISVAAPIRSRSTETVRQASVRERAVRLERMSLGEVALRTVPRPQWRAQVVEAKRQSTTIRFVPLRTAQATAPAIRLLNAARRQGLAAQTRTLLADRGWRRLKIGDATHVRQTSLILYPASRKAAADRLAAQFGFRVAQRASGRDLIVLLGRDATRALPRSSHG